MRAVLTSNTLDINHLLVKFQRGFAPGLDMYIKSLL